ncbi:M48 family metallopeptidase [Xanthobacter sediminis]
MQAFGLYTHIRANRVRSGFLIAGLFLLIYVMVFAGALLAEAFTREAPLDALLRQALHDLVQALPWATAAALAWLVIAYYFNRALIAASTGAHAVTRQDEPKLYTLLENLCISRGLPAPRLYVVDTPVLNAFATGLNEKQYSITVTRGLLEALDDAELEAVLAHELTHIRNGDVRLMVIAVVIAGVISFVGELVFRGWANMSIFTSRRRDSGDDRKQSGGGAALAIVIALVLMAVAWLLSQLIRFALSRSREYLADAGAVELTKNPDAMITALLKIDGRGELPGVPSGVMELCIDNPRSGIADLFATHPSISARVDRLVRYAGGHLPAPTSPGPTDGPWGPTGARAASS